jgi:hypothetical protein
MPPITPIQASFGQTVLRKNPEFYLFTRYFVQDAATGAFHVFRLKHLVSETMLKANVQEKFLQMKYASTKGYLSGLLQQMWV